MTSIPIDIVDAFADRPFAGNPAAIVPEAAGLADAVMLQITEELRMEAGFVLPARAAGADLRLRFFTPRREAMLSGHVIVAAMTSLAARGRFAGGAEPQALRVETGRGVLPVTVAPADGGVARVTFELPAPRFGEPVPIEEAAAALGVPAAALMLGEHRPQRVSCGFDVLVVPIADRAAAWGAMADLQPIRRLADRLGVGGVVCFCPDTRKADVDLFCRFFYPSEGTDEDVVSGTSLGAITAYCLEHGVLPARREARVVTEQGHALGRPNRAVIEARMEGGRCAGIRLAAAGVVVLRGTLQPLAAAAGAPR